MEVRDGLLQPVGGGDVGRVEHGNELAHGEAQTQVQVAGFESELIISVKVIDTNAELSIFVRHFLNDCVSFAVVRTVAYNLHLESVERPIEGTHGLYQTHDNAQLVINPRTLR